MSRRIDWYYWLLAAVLLSGALLGAPYMLAGALALAGLQIVDFAIRSRGLISFPLQVRTAYLLLLVAGCWPPLGFVHWIQAVGTWAVVLTDYCLLARCLSLMPWNRGEPVTWAEVLRAFLRPPTAGSVMQGSARKPG